MQIYGWLFREKRVCDQPGKQVCHEVFKTSMPSVFHLTYILQFIIDGFNQRPFLQGNLILNVHQAVFHALADFSDQVYPIDEELLKERFADAALVAEQFSEDFIMERFVPKRLSIINIALREYEVKDFTPIVDDQMKLKPEKPPNGALPLGG